MPTSGSTPIPAPAPSADLSYPIGRMPRTPILSPEARHAAIEAIAETPAKLRKAVAGLTDEQLDTPYRPDGWTVRQLVHHVADSHMHAYARTKFALAETGTTITPYDEARWAELPDMRTMPVAVSLDLLDALHARWVHVLRATSADEFRRTIQHPANGEMTVDDLLGAYQWHGRHHTAHVTGLRQRMGWH
jgi:uncharacterized damage-inducible protein DinB